VFSLFFLSSPSVFADHMKVVDNFQSVSGQVGDVQIISGGVLQLQGIAGDIYVEEGGELYLQGIAGNVTNDGGKVVIQGIANMMFTNSGYTEIQGVIQSYLIGEGETRIFAGAVINNTRYDREKWKNRYKDIVKNSTNINEKTSTDISEVEDYFRNNLIHETLTNSFQGTLNSSGKDQPAVTSFFIENGGKIAGNYIFYEGSNDKYSGDLYDCNILDLETLKCTWKDDWGDGVFLVIFSEDFNSFNGYWSDYDMNNKYNWNGKR
jgi:hypothetical protein